MHAEQRYFIKTALYQWFHNRQKPKSFEKILVVKLDEIGDMATALHVFEELKTSWPNAHIALWCKPFNTNLVETNPFIDQVVTDRNQLNSNYDAVVELRGNEESWSALKTISFPYYTCRGTVRIRNKWRGGQPHEIETNRRIIEAICVSGLRQIEPKIYLTDEDRAFAASYIQQNNLSQYALFHVGARDVARQWPLERFAEIARFFYEYNYHVVFIGGPSDEESVERCRAQIDVPTFSVAGKTTLRQLAALCEKASYFLGNESGPMHIADRFPIPILGLFGPGVKDVFYPTGADAQVIHYFKERNHTQQTAADSTILEITVDEVKQRIVSMIQRYA
jgi:ADP-heptose:LPS heptosyltransferase